MQILAFSRQNEHELKPVALSSVVEDTLAMMRPLLPSTIKIRNAILVSQDAVSADPLPLQQVLMNLCTNAAYAMRGKGVTLEVSLSDGRIFGEEVSRRPGMEPGSFVIFSVSDTGSGRTSEVMEKIFDPFFTTKGPGEGTGTGLRWPTAS